MKIVNRLKGIYFLVGLFGISLFFGMFIVAPETVFAPGDGAELATSDFSHFGKPDESSISDKNSTSEKIETSSMRLVFTGDVMLARAVEWAMKEQGAEYPFTLWNASFFTDADAVIGNFESTVRDVERIEPTNVMTFDTLPAYLPPLQAAGFTHLSLSNNHADDFGQATTDFTRSTIAEMGMIPFGDPFAGENFVAHIDGDTPVALIGFHAFNEEVSGIVHAISAEEAAGNFVVVYPHWGTEYEHVPSAYQMNAADAWIAAGADLIIGAHPHVVQRVETRSGVPVIYSLGNFLFDQDFSSATQVGALADVTISESDIVITFSPIRITARQTFMNHDDDELVRAWLGLESLTWTNAREASQTP